VAEPPSTLDPAAFLREHVAPRVERRVARLRSDVERLQRELDDHLTAEATVQLVLEGEGGGVWYLNLREGRMSVSELAETDPLIRVYQRRSDWEALARGQVSAGAPAAGAGVVLTRSRIERLRGVAGTFEFRLTGEAERWIRVQFGPGEPTDPRCTVSIGAADFARLQAGELAPQAAFLQGLVKVQGDVAFAMQVATALLA
jgi:hypothetical protein